LERDLKLSLISCPIALYPATSAAERVLFRQTNKKTGNPVGASMAARRRAKKKRA
jgi:non-homologous end joining protein Ku